MNTLITVPRVALVALSIAACATPIPSHAQPRNQAQAQAQPQAGVVRAGTAWLIHAGALIDGQRDQVRRQVSIQVRDGKITAVRAGYQRPARGEQLVDLSEYTVLPGLMDMHTHLTVQMSPRSYSEGFFLDPADYALRASLFARRTLMAGFTTVRDLGDHDNVSVSLREAIAKGWVVGPRIFTAAKSIATTGGHADPTNGLNRELMGDPGPREGVINSPEEARRAVRQRYKDGADLIKITATGGVLSLAANGQNPQFTPEELRAVVAAARDYGFTVAVHAHGAEGMKRAVVAGVDSIEHGTFMTDEIMALMREHGTYYVPTISAGRFVAAEAARENGFLPDVVRPKAAAIGPQIQETFARAYRAGVRIAFGTDSGVSPHGDNAQEFVYMVEAGMPPMVAIQSATREAAKLLRIDDRLGTVEPGKVADIVAVRGDPIADISVLTSVAFVMKDGKVYKLP
ncbi:amidohydrolase family protein [Haliangium sp.]|uniref:metal-dependent hydrolase family protein n=1 Tax=Haliangium sp. TaxID=2663208 RepID=UPI003D0DE24C